MILPQCIFLLAVTTIASCQSSNDVVDNNSRSQAKTIVHEVKLNEAFDIALPDIKWFMTTHGFDHMNIPDFQIPLTHFPGWLPAKIILHHGYIQQLSTIYRTGDIILQYSSKKVSLYLNIGWEALEVHHQYDLRCLLYHRKGGCYGCFHDVVARLLVEFDRKTNKIDLKFLRFLDAGDFKLRLEGHFGDKLLNLLTSAITKIFRKQVLRAIEARTYEEVDKIVQQFNNRLLSPVIST